MRVASEHISIQREVYYVEGLAGAILYDSRSGYLYHLNAEAKHWLNSLLSTQRYIPNAKDETLLKYLSDKDLIVREVNNWDGDIHRVRTNPKIAFAWIEITTACNLKCIHCYEGEALQRCNHMSIPTYKHIVDELCENRITKIQLIGGEPLASPHIKDFLDYAVGKFEFIEVYTNATLITPLWIEYFKKNNIRVAVSIYSYCEKCHDAVTQVNGSWGASNKSIELLAGANIKYRVRNVLMKGVELGEKNTVLYALNENKDVVRMVGNANPRLMTSEHLRKRIITKQRFSSPVAKAFVARLVSGHNCFSTHLFFAVDGTVYPCVMERRLSHGNINDSHLSSMLNHKILEFGKDYVQECQCCEYRYFCFDCRPDSLERSIDSKPWYCTYDPLQGKWADPETFISNFIRASHC